MTRSLRNRRDFAKIYAEGEKRVGRLLVFYTLPAEDDAQAVVASRKVGDAVRRNRAKRLLREALRAVAGDNPADVRFPRGRVAGSGAGVWAVLVARREIVGAGLPEVRQDLESVLRVPPRG